LTAQSGLTLDEARRDEDYWGRLTESAVGAHLANAAAGGECELFYWRERDREVDFVVKRGNRLTAIEVKTGRTLPQTLPGMEVFAAEFRSQRRLLVGTGGIPLETFLSEPARHWTA
jgi:predicted AAA+ superfamily ATPase